MARNKQPGAPAPEEGSVAVEDNVKVNSSASVSPSKNEALVVDRDGWIFRIYANENDCDRCHEDSSPCPHGKREKKYLQQLKAVKAKGQRRLSKTENEEYDVYWDGKTYPPYAVVGPKFAAMAEGFVKKFNYKPLAGDIGYTPTDSIRKNDGYRLRLNPQVFFEYQDTAAILQQSSYFPVRPLKVVYQ